MKKNKHKRYNLAKHIKDISSLNDEELVDRSVNLLCEFERKFAKIMQQTKQECPTFFADGTALLLDEIFLDVAFADGTFDDVEYSIIRNFYLNAYGKEIRKTELQERYESFSDDARQAAYVLVKSLMEDSKNYNSLPNALWCLAWTHEVNRSEYDKIIQLYDRDSNDVPRSWEAFEELVEKTHS